MGLVLGAWLVGFEAFDADLLESGEEFADAVVVVDPALGVVGLVLGDRARATSCQDPACSHVDRPSRGFADAVGRIVRAVDHAREERSQLLDRHRTAEQEALDLVTSEGFQVLPIPGGFDALGDDA